MDRIQKLMQQLNTPYLVEQTDDLYYLTGLNLSKGRLFVSSSEVCLFVDGRYFAFAKRQFSHPVFMWEEQKAYFAKQSTIGFDGASTTYDAYLTLQKELPHITWVTSPSPVKMLRLVKDASEIAILKKSAKITWAGYQEIVRRLRVGVSEEEIALDFEIYCRKNGASRLSFDPIIAFGENSAYPHHRAGKTRLEQDQIVLIDIGAVVDHYSADMTRMVHFGTIDPQLLHFEQIVQQAQQKAISQVRPGLNIRELDRIVREEFDRAHVKQLYTHSLGHGIGLETHEYPRIRIDGDDLVLQPGMVFTIEPGLYQPGLGGIRIEDMVLVTATGYENFFAPG